MRAVMVQQDQPNVMDEQVLVRRYGLFENFLPPEMNLDQVGSFQL